MDFTGIYEHEHFYQHKRINWINCLDIKGTHGYCSDEAAKEICKRIKDLSYQGIHFIDSGNFHYVSLFWLEKIPKDFVLVFLDHHCDMLKPVFGDLLSCGSWVLEALKNLQHLKKVIMIGIDSSQVELIDRHYLDQIIYFTDQDSVDIQKIQEVHHLLQQYPIYVSIDKDVLSKRVIKTDWQQGKMAFLELKLILADVIKRSDVLGIDVCGECGNEVVTLHNIEDNDRLNYQIMEFIQRELKENV